MGSGPEAWGPDDFFSYSSRFLPSICFILDQLHPNSSYKPGGFTFVFSGQGKQILRGPLPQSIFFFYAIKQPASRIASISPISREHTHRKKVPFEFLIF